MDKLITWAKSQTIDLKPKPGKAFGFGYNDPREVPPEEFRFDLALTIPENFKLNNQVIERVLPAGRYAVTTHKGSRVIISVTRFTAFIEIGYRNLLKNSVIYLAYSAIITLTHKLLKQNF